MSKPAHVKFAPLGNLSPGSPAMVEGNKLAARENMPEDSHNRRMAGLVKAWATKARMNGGEKVVTKRQKTKAGRKARRQRVKLHITVAKEAREIQEKCRTLADHAVERVAELLDAPQSRPQDIIAAADFINNRAYGRPSQTNINANIDASKPQDVSEEELDKRIEETLSRVERLAGRAPKKEAGQERPADVRKLN